jgi:hypothetical protein
MTLLISEERVQEVLREERASPSYVVTPVLMRDAVEPEQPEATSITVHSTQSTPLEVTEAHRRIMELRSRLKDLGVAPVADEELDRR